jgi:hypothetical protein
LTYRLKNVIKNIFEKLYLETEEEFVTVVIMRPLIHAISRYLFLFIPFYITDIRRKFYPNIITSLKHIIINKLNPVET